MGKVVIYASVSVDGFIADDTDQPGPLFDWLMSGDVPLVFAHTVLPYHPRGPLTGWLARLGNRSLGALLFADPGFMRGKLANRRIDARHELFDAAVRALALEASPPRLLWARRSRFHYGAQSVLVTEIFAPQVSEQTEHQ